MLSRTDLRGRAPSPAELRTLLPRAEVDVDAVLHQVRPLVEDVRARGVEAALELSERFDGVRPAAVRVPARELTAGLAYLPAPVREALEETIERARLVHADQRRTDVTTQVVPGGTVTERWVPVRRVGLYAPGGLAVYPSSVVMNVVPAQTAGVESLVVCSPPQAEFGGLPHPTVLAAAELLGVTEVWAVGGAQAVALLAYGGTDTDGTPLDPVDMVTGPGNVYLTAAKRLLRGLIGIDSEALAEAVDTELDRQVGHTRHTERIRTALSGAQSGCVLVADVDAGLSVVDAYAAEHLEVQTADAAGVAARVRAAGAVFVGAHSPVSLGDYCAGSNHVLPTGGCARHSSGLSVQTFLRGIHVVDYSAAALAAVADKVVALADAEDLPAHGQAVTARFGGRDD